MNVGELLKTFLDDYHSESAELDVQLLLAHAMGRPRSWISAHLDAPLTPPQLDSATQAFAQLQAGTPLPYILGHWEFYGLDLDITPDVLIPRPETELLVEKAIQWLTNRPEARSVADIGTGSGAIAISIAKHISDVQILATDISPNALQVAKRNAEKHEVAERIQFAECDLLPNSEFKIQNSKFDLICANLPYIPTETLHGLPVYGREPTLALDGGTDGLDLVRRLLELAPDWLAPRGMMLLEIEASEGAKALSLAYDAFEEVNLKLKKDLAGNDRLLIVRPL
ncbi:MAG TPA: peptide chain release factor N(5)-glutamine methyltransferase [Anaerolineales bacterium]|nr:peptide chain release factor N(5)-glutamine methyltransferase [Anaerolineales bacterium]